MKFGMEEILPFSKAISFAIYNESWQLTMDSETKAQYLNLIMPYYIYFPIFCVTWLWTWQKCQL